MRFFIVAITSITLAPHGLAKTPKAPDEVVETIVENSAEGEEGLVQPATGGAKPIENWFGCKPTESSDDAASPCETQPPGKSSAQ